MQGCFIHCVGIQSLQSVIQRYVDSDSRQLDTKKINECGQDNEQPSNAIQLPKAEHNGDQQSQNRTNPDQNENRLIVLDNTIDHLKRSDEVPVIQTSDSRHHHDCKRKQET